MSGEIRTDTRIPVVELLEFCVRVDKILFERRLQDFRVNQNPQLFNASTVEQSQASLKQFGEKFREPQVRERRDGA